MVDGTTKVAWISQADVTVLNTTHNGDRAALVQDLITNHGFDAAGAKLATAFLDKQPK